MSHPLQIKTSKPPVLHDYLLAPGVEGWAVQRGDEIHIEQITAVREGSGAVGKFLDALPANAYVVNIVSDRLKGMLERRGFKCEWRGGFLERLDYWSRP